MQSNDLSSLLENQLGLTEPPVAVAFVDEQPPGVPRTLNVVPSACAFWRQAEQGTFFASAEDHFNCPLGAMVMGFPLPDEQMSQLMEEVGMMCGISYVREEEVPNVPKVTRASAGIVYGPLAGFPVEPDAVLLWCTPHQAMKMSECCGLINWAASPAGMFGRPGCAALPIALTLEAPSQSFGCVGMRINTGVDESKLLMVIPRNILNTITSSLPQMSDIHQQMESHYNNRMANLPQSTQ